MECVIIVPKVRNYLLLIIVPHFNFLHPLISGFPFGPHLVDPINSSMMGGPAAASVGGGPTCNTTSAASNPDPSVKVTLENEDLWRRFHEIGTEMIITKMGR